MSFSEILDAHLGCTDVPRAADQPPAGRAWSGRPLTSPLVAFEQPLVTARPALPEPPPTRLTALERQTLDAAATPDALRRAFRSLARRYHPDRHPGCSAADRERLARLFTEAAERYQLRATWLAARPH